jgi:hypothetical protein
MEHSKTPWEREFAQDGEYTGPGDNPPGYIGEMYETNHVGWLNRETGEWTPVADFYRETDCIKALLAVNSHEALVEACKAAYMFIKNGIDFGFIRMPDDDCPDPAKDVPGIIDAALKLAGVKP